jgi:hypothetical protein
MAQERERIRAFLWWVAGHLVGWLFIVALVTTLPIAKFTHGFVAPLLILGVPFSVAQWMVLHRYVPLTPLWMLTIPAGWLLFSLLIAAVPPAWWQAIGDETIPTLSLSFALLGAAMGLPQWVILRRRFPRAPLWIVGSSLSVGLGFGLVLATGLINRSETISYTVVILVYGMVTGLILWWWLDRHTLARLRPSAAA